MLAEGMPGNVAMGSSSDSGRRAFSWRRAVMFRLVAVLLGLAPFALGEVLFVILGWGRPTQHDDPFVGFGAIHPLFVRSDDGSRYETARSRWRCFQPQSFAARKAPNEYRIFCLGGSTVQGRPFAVETSFTTWLELNLRLAEPRRRWRVINCGGISYASYRLVPILKEVLGYEPDMIILCTGHNEFLEDREYAHIRDRPRWLAGPWELLARTRTYNLAREGYLRLRGTSLEEAWSRKPVLKADVEAILDYRGGLEEYHRDEKRRRDVIEHFRYNVARMVRMSRGAGVRIVLVNPVCGLRGCPPFKSQHRDGLTGEQLRLWTALCRQADKHVGPPAVQLLRQALTIDDQHAGLHYYLAQELDALGQKRQARQAYVRAKELDVCPLRILEPMNEAICRIARQTGTPLVDVRKLIEQASPDGIPGDSLLCDHVHPRIAAHRLIADALTDELARQGVVHPRPGWKQQQDKKAYEHIGSLGYSYFDSGFRRLESVRGWAAGRASLAKPEPPPDEH